MYRKGGDNMKGIFVYSDDLSPLENLYLQKYVQLFGKLEEFEIAGQKVTRLVLPAGPHEGVIEGINY